VEYTPYPHLPQLMLALFADLFSENFIPHGHCYLWKPELVWLHIISDGITALAYYSIPFVLVYFVSKRKDLPFNWIFWLFGAFIIFCGTGHLLEIWTLWHPTYWVSGVFKAITAIVSLFTALELIPLIPKALALPSPALLEATNRELEKQITERRRADEELQESEARFTAFMNNSPAVTFIKDGLGQFVYINHQFEKIFDITLPQLQNKTHLDWLPSDVIEQLEANDLAVLNSNQTHELVETLPTPNGQNRNWLVLKFPIPQLGKETYIGGIALDITDREQMQTALRQNSARLQQALDFEAALKRITDKVRDSLDESQILQTAVHELGVSLGVRGCTAGLYNLQAGTVTIGYEYTNSMFPKKGQVISMAEFPEIYAQLGKGQYFQFCDLDLDPVHGRVATIACPIVNDQQEVLGELRLINDKDYGFRDLELRVVQQVANQCAIAIRQARLFHASQVQVEELERLNRLKDDFLSTVSHELRTPMSNIKMATQMLEVSLQQKGWFKQADDRISRYFQVLQDEGNREISLINDLLDLSRLDMGSEPLILCTVDAPESWLDTIARPFKARAQSQQQAFSLKVSPQLSNFTTDCTELERILVELLTNACKYTPPGETIELVADVVEDGIQFCVSNSGVQIPAEEIDRIFDKFYRIPKHDPWKHGGTGLGLALVKKRAAKLGASLQVESQAYRITFTLFLPSEPQPTASANHHICQSRFAES
jgi:PAS domain S-box-containing protein